MQMPLPVSPRRRKLLFIAGLFLLVVVGVQGLAWTGWLKGPDTFYYDLWHQMAGVRHQPRDVVIVAVDGATLAAHPKEPLVTWTPYWAKAVQVLRAVGARAIGLDYFFKVSIESWLKKLDLPAGEAILNFDAPFKEQLASGEVVIAGRLVLHDHEKTKIVLPVKEFAAALPQPQAVVGLVNLTSDEDGAIRCYTPALKDDYGEVFLTFPELLAVRWQGRDPLQAIDRFQADPRLKVWSEEEEDEAAFPYISFVGPPGTITRLSFERLLAPRATEDPKVQALKGKVIIVAYEPTGGQDRHLTPYAQGFWLWPGLDMSGAEIHANILETVLSGRTLRKASWFLGLAVLMVFLAAGFVLFFRLSSWQGLAALAFLSALAAALGYGLFLTYVILPVAPVQVGLALGYVGVLGLRLTGEEREKRRLRQMFGRYVSKEVVESLLATGARPNLGGEAYQVTVLFTDIRDFTAMAEALAPGHLVEMLNTYFSRAIEPILAAGGTVDKFMGDAIMAVFGAPARYPDHARRAVQAALGLAHEAREFQTWMAARFPGLQFTEYTVGVGLHTGEAVVGNIGSPKRLEYTTIGDTVNTAARLEGMSKKLGWTIVASRATLKASGPGVVTGGRETLTVKGRKEPVEVHEVLDLASG